MATGWTCSLWPTAMGCTRRENPVSLSCFLTWTLQEHTASWAKRSILFRAVTRYWFLMTTESESFKNVRTVMLTFDSGMFAGVFSQQSGAPRGDALILCVQRFPQLYPKKRWPSCSCVAKHVCLQAHSHAQPRWGYSWTLQVRTARTLVHLPYDNSVKIFSLTVTEIQSSWAHSFVFLYALLVPCKLLCYLYMKELCQVLSSHTDWPLSSYF